MGAILAKFRKEKSTAEILEGLEEKIKQLEKYTLNTQEQKRRIVGNFLATSIGIYVIAFIVFYFIYFPPTWRERMLYSVPLLLFPVVIILLRRVFAWYFERKLNNSSNKLTVLHAEKKKILEQVMDKETYKVAVKLLARYGDKNNGQKSLYAMNARVSAGSNLNIASQRLTTGQSPNAPVPTGSLHELWLRPTLSNTSFSATPCKVGGVLNTSPGAPLPAGSQAMVPCAPLAVTPQRRPVSNEMRRRTPFPILNEQGKGALERIVDILIGDGPKDRFAMICKECYAHNGMALKEDFEYTTFRCAFCNALNPSRKARPIAPRLPDQHLSQLKYGSDSSPSTSSSTDIDSENDERAEVTMQSAATPRIELTDATNSPTTTGTSNVDDKMQCQTELPPGDGTAETADAVDEEGETETNSTKVVADLQALHAGEVDELSRLQARFAKMYATDETEDGATQVLDDDQIEDKAAKHEAVLEQAGDIDELKKLK